MNKNIHKMTNILPQCSMLKTFPRCNFKLEFQMLGHVTDCPTMHYFGNPRHTLMKALWFWLSISGNTAFCQSIMDWIPVSLTKSKIAHCGRLFNMPYYIVVVFSILNIRLPILYGLVFETYSSASLQSNPTLT